MMKQTFHVLLIIILGTSLKLHAQTIQINGFIADAESGEPLIGANVFNPKGMKGCISNNFGFYTLPATANKPVILQFSYVGYQPQHIRFIPTVDTLLRVYLQAGTMLNEFQVKANPNQRLEELPEMGKLDIPLDQIALIPTMTGEPDLLKAYQLMPGVQGGTEGHNGLFVRGGTPDQNLYLLDDVPLFNVSHIGGLYSVFDPSMVKSIDFYKGGFPARYGGRTSAVIDVRNKDGNLKEWKGELGLSLILSKFFIEGPLKKDKSSFAFSIRRSNLDLYSYLYGAVSDREYIVGYTFYDINAKTNLYLNEKDRLIINIYHGRDKYFYNDKKQTVDTYTYKTKFNQRWGNSTGSARWQHIIGKKVFQNITLALTKYVYKNNISLYSYNSLDDEETTDQYSIFSGVNNLILKADYEIPLKKNSLKTGVQFNHQIYVPTRISYDEYNLNEDGIPENEVENHETKLFANQWTAYAEYLFSLDKLSGNAGLHTTSYIVNGVSYPSLQPRLVLNYLLAPTVSIKGSAGLMYQNTHLLTNSNTGLSTDLWIPSTDKIAPEKSQQVALGIAHTSNNNIEFSVEAYHKKLSQLISYKEGVIMFNVGENWEDKVETGGVGQIKGLEFLIQKKSGRLTGWIGYTLSKNERKFENLNNAEIYPFKYDQRHDLSIVTSYKFNKKWALSATWVYHTGHAVTLPLGKYQLYNYEYLYINGSRDTYVDVHIYKEKNSFRMPNYHRLDIGWTYTKKKPKGTAKWTWGIYNAYNRQNAYYLFFKEKDGETKLYQQSIFPIFLNFGYTYAF